KMALQYWQNKGQPNKNKFICFRGGYHGDTLGAISVSSPEEGMHHAFRHVMPKQYVLDIPSGEYALAEFQEMMSGIGRNVAGLIIEPLVQGAEGMRFHSPDVLAAIYQAARENDVLFIADEVATGFGRTGLMFACEEAGISPDIMCLSKALTGGTIPLAATMAQEWVFEAFLSHSMEHAFVHGPTYMANPLACSAAIASLELFEREDRLAQIEAIEMQLHDELMPCRAIEGVADVRIKGAIGVVELEGEIDRHWFNTRFVEEGVWIRPLENIVYLMPAFTISKKALRSLTGAVMRVIKEWSEHRRT
ncbi:MAG: aminotransferase class III-fold pyridoxal phosphate-dependent enzyme, partial [Rickettsiales bacterium]